MWNDVECDRVWQNNKGHHKHKSQFRDSEIFSTHFFLLYNREHVKCFDENENKLKIISWRNIFNLCDDDATTTRKSRAHSCNLDSNRSNSCTRRLHLNDDDGLEWMKRAAMRSEIIFRCNTPRHRVKLATTTAKTSNSHVINELVIDYTQPKQTRRGGEMVKKEITPKEKKK